MDIDNIKLGFIGAGNMATAIINGVVRAELISAEKIFVSDLDASRLEALKKNGVNVSSKNQDVIEKSDIIILAVKPNIYEIVLQEISKLSNVEEKIFVTIAPGLTIEYIKSFFNTDIKVVRTMPNTPAQIGQGMTVMCYQPPVSDNEYGIVSKIFSSIGEVETISEGNMNAVVAVNGSSPAYVYMMIEAMADAAVMRGIPRKVAYKLAAQSVAGSAKMVLETGKHPGELKDMVCSPGGTTIQAVYQLEKSGFRAGLIEAMEKCTETAIQMSTAKGDNIDKKKTCCC